MTFEHTLNMQYWRDKLGRQLDLNEMRLFYNVKNECDTNKKIKAICQNVEKKNLKLKHLVSMSGNCFFDCLEYLKIIEPESCLEFKIMIGMIMLLFKDMKNFIPEQDLTLEEIFNNTNEIEFVICKNTKKIYKYNYVAMCYDLMSDNNTSWTRLPTQMVIIVISTIMNINFNIYHNTSYVSTIGDNNTNKTCNLALLDEFHYLPLETCDNNKDNAECNNDMPIYRQYYDMFCEWGQQVTQKN